MKHLPLLFLSMLAAAIREKKTEISLAGVATTPPPITKPSCKNLSRCGTVMVPYPFGLSPACAISSSFEIQCDDTSQYPYITLQGSTHTISSISDSRLRVSNVYAWSRYTIIDENRQMFEVRGTSVDLEGSPYSFSELNKFSLLGCAVYALIESTDGFNNYTSGCMSLCNSTADVTEDGECVGIVCCRKSIAQGLKFFSISIGNVRKNLKLKELPFRSPLGFLFLGEEGKVSFEGVSNLSKYIEESVPMVLDWAIGEIHCSEAQKLGNYCCQAHSRCVNSGRGYRCVCYDGYDGNAYLEPGCTDVDECADPDKHDCVDKCINTVGGYKCLCPSGNHGDGRKSGKGCVESKFRRSGKRLILGIVLSSSGVTITIYVTIEINKRRLKRLRKLFFKRNEGDRLVGSARVFTAEELERATNKYAKDRVLGRGGSGAVYKGILDDKQVVAVKRAKKVNPNQTKQFMHEAIILTKVNHPNVVKLLGCCLETKLPWLVYEFVSNGTLSSHIHKSDDGSGEEYSWLSSWEERLRIAAEAAGALAHLHSADSSTPVIHANVKPANILIDENRTAKLADIGASTLVPLDKTEVTALVQGRFGYLDPECLQSGKLTPKSDVYSFGVLLAELLTGKEVASTQASLATDFVDAVDENRLSEILDPRITREGLQHDQFQQVGLLIKRCLNLRGKDRPTMKEVAVELEKMRKSNTPDDDHEMRGLNLTYSNVHASFESASPPGSTQD